MSFGPESRRVSYFSSIGPGTSGPKMCPKMRFRHKKIWWVVRDPTEGQPTGASENGKIEPFLAHYYRPFWPLSDYFEHPSGSWSLLDLIFAIANKVEEAAGAIGRPKIANFGAKTGGKNEPKNVEFVHVRMPLWAAPLSRSGRWGCAIVSKVQIPPKCFTSHPLGEATERRQMWTYPFFFGGGKSVHESFFPSLLDNVLIDRLPPSGNQ